MIKMDSDLYDEFGNYIGPDLSDPESDEEEYEEPDVSFADFRVHFGFEKKYFYFNRKYDLLTHYSINFRTMPSKMKPRWKWMKTKRRKQ